MPKKLFGLIGIFILAIGLLVSLNLASQKQDIRKKASGTGSTLTIEPASISVNKDETFSVAVTINTGDDTVSAAELHLTYDPSVISGISITPGEFLPTQIVTGRNTNGNADIVLGAKMEYDNTGKIAPVPRKGTGTLVTLTFKALNASSTPIDFTKNSTQIASIEKNGNTLAQATGGNVTVVEVQPTPTATPPPDATPTPIPPTDIPPTYTPTPIPPTDIPPTDTPIPSPTPTGIQPTDTPTPTTTMTPSNTPIPGSCPIKNQGDADCKDGVDGVDYSIWLNSQCHAGEGEICASKDADFNNDGFVDDKDYSIWFQYRDN